MANPDKMAGLRAKKVQKIHSIMDKDYYRNPLLPKIKKIVEDLYKKDPQMSMIVTAYGANMDELYEMVDWFNCHYEFDRLAGGYYIPIAILMYPSSLLYALDGYRKYKNFKQADARRQYMQDIYDFFTQDKAFPEIEPDFG